MPSISPRQFALLSLCLILHFGRIDNCKLRGWFEIQLDLVELVGPDAVPNPDEVDEVKVLQNNYDAKYSLMGASVVIVQTKSGTGTFHGGAWEFLRNTVLDTRNFFSPTISPEEWNIFGWNLGGPVFLPHRYNTNRQKTFFYFNQQWAKQKQASVIKGATPTPPMRTGIFPTTGPYAKTITDPAAGGAPFPGNQIPVNRINQADLAYLNALALPPNNQTTVFNNYINTLPWLMKSTGWKRTVIGGWKLSEVTTIQSGSSLTMGMNTANTGLAARPNLIGAAVTYPKSMQQWFSTDAFAKPANGFFGNVGNGTIQGPGLIVFNMAAYKDFRIREGLTLQFRGEFFNALNHTNLNGPGTNLGAGTFGQITSAKDPRTGELALKLRF